VSGCTQIHFDRQMKHMHAYQELMTGVCLGLI